VIVSAGEVSRIRDYLVQAARGSDGLPLGLAAWNVRRVEAGLPWYGVDFTGESFPEEARLGEAVNFTKATFRGREAIERLGRGKHGSRALVGFVIEDDGPLWAADGGTATPPPHALDLRALVPPGSPIHTRVEKTSTSYPSTTEPIGRVTSAVYSPALRKALFMGCVRRESLEDDPLFFVDTTRGALRLRTIELPIPFAEP
jgi:glycine cleavage system aminomethyltransferase T